MLWRMAKSRRITICLGSNSTGSLSLLIHKESFV